MKISKFSVYTERLIYDIRIPRISTSEFGSCSINGCDYPPLVMYDISDRECRGRLGYAELLTLDWEYNRDMQRFESYFGDARILVDGSSHGMNVVITIPGVYQTTVDTSVGAFWQLNQRPPDVFPVDDSIGGDKPLYDLSVAGILAPDSEKTELYGIGGSEYLIAFTGDNHKVSHSVRYCDDPFSDAFAIRLVAYDLYETLHQRDKS